MNMKNCISPDYITKNVLVLVMILLAGALPLQAQEAGDSGLQPLRSDVGIIGVTANIDAMGRYTYMGSDTLLAGTNSELEFEFRDVRMASPRIGVGFQAMTSVFVDGSNFGFGSWGLGPVVRGYPLKTPQWQPYFQADALFGNNMGVGELADTRTGADGFRIRMGLRGGMAYRLSNKLGLFFEVGYDWESSEFFRADARVLQFNIGLDLYRFKR